VFDAIYNWTVARPRGVAELDVAPPPRRFAMGLAGSMALAIGIALLTSSAIAARSLELIAIAAVISVVVGRVCAPAKLCHVLRRALGYQPLRLRARQEQGC
jgi:hypothetical protein